MTSRATGQTTPTADGNQELMQEVRALRMAIERATIAGVRSQLLLGRVQLQETRVLTLSRHLQDTRNALAAAQREQATAAAAVKNMEEETVRAITPEQRRDLDLAIRDTKLRVDRFDAEIRRLQGEEAAAAQTVATEQARWSEFNQRLEELERVLATPQR